ncbi:inositol polyphosphate kinase, putative [Plasmodium gaboni]|uniref:Kinase n=1 Tax=Plasmodium gaboni TaxID=647221 RepID=A0ABY1URF9_9APIC|nr:inositol polyphosphate kinase, putative [Plasmodium gaboni]
MNVEEYRHQVGGHCKLIKPKDSSKVYKPLIENEYIFYKKLTNFGSSSTESGPLHLLKKFIPKFYGVTEILVESCSDDEEKQNDSSNLIKGKDEKKKKKKSRYKKYIKMDKPEKDNFVNTDERYFIEEEKYSELIRMRTNISNADINENAHENMSGGELREHKVNHMKCIEKNNVSNIYGDKYGIENDEINKKNDELINKSIDDLNNKKNDELINKSIDDLNNKKNDEQHTKQNNDDSVKKRFNESSLNTTPKKFKRRKECVPHIILEDLVYGFKRPCVLDIKMGKRQRKIGASIEKKKRQVEKSFKTTSHSLGFRLCGCQHYNKVSDTLFYKDKYWGRNLRKEHIPWAIRNWFWNGSLLYEELIPLLLEKLHSFFNCIVELRHYRFWSSSLLWVFDGGLSDKKARSNSLDIRMIDFANTIYLQDNPSADEEYIFGLRNLIESIQILNNSIHNIYFLPYEITTCFYSENYNMKEIKDHKVLKKSRSVVYEDNKKKKKKTVYINMEFFKKAKGKYVSNNKQLDNNKFVNNNKNLNIKKNDTKTKYIYNSDLLSTEYINKFLSQNEKEEIHKNKKKNRNGNINKIKKKKKKKFYINENKYQSFSDYAIREDIYSTPLFSFANKLHNSLSNNPYNIKNTSYMNNLGIHCLLNNNSVSTSRVDDNPDNEETFNKCKYYEYNDSYDKNIGSSQNDIDPLVDTHLYDENNKIMYSTCLKEKENIYKSLENTMDKSLNNTMNNSSYIQNYNYDKECMNKIKTYHTSNDRININNEEILYGNKNVSRSNNIYSHSDERKKNILLKKSYNMSIQKKHLPYQIRECNNNKTKDGKDIYNDNTLNSIDDKYKEDTFQNKIHLNKDSLENIQEKKKNNILNNHKDVLKYMNNNMDNIYYDKNINNNINNNILLLPYQNKRKNKPILDNNIHAMSNNKYDEIIQETIIKTLKIASNFYQKIKEDINMDQQVKEKEKLSKPCNDNYNKENVQQGEEKIKKKEDYSLSYYNVSNEPINNNLCEDNKKDFYSFNCDENQKDISIETYKDNVNFQRKNKDDNIKRTKTNYKKEISNYYFEKEEMENMNLIPEEEENIIHEKKNKDTQVLKTNKIYDNIVEKNNTNHIKIIKNFNVLKRNINLKVLINQMIKMEIEKWKLEKQQLLLKNKQISKLTNKQISKLTNKQINKLTNKQINKLTNKQINKLTSKQNFLKRTNIEMNDLSDMNVNILEVRNKIKQMDIKENMLNKMIYKLEKDTLYKSNKNNVYEQLNYNSDTILIHKDFKNYHLKMNKKNSFTHDCYMYKRCMSCNDDIISYLKNDNKIKEKKEKQNKKKIRKLFLKKLNMLSNMKNNKKKYHDNVYYKVDPDNSNKAEKEEYINKYNEKYYNKYDNKYNVQYNDTYNNIYDDICDNICDDKYINAINKNPFPYSKYNLKEKKKKKKYSKYNQLNILPLHKKKYIYNKEYPQNKEEFNIFNMNYEKNIYTFNNIKYTNENLNYINNIYENNDLETYKNLILPLTETNENYKYLRRSLSEPNIYKYNRFMGTQKDSYVNKINYNNLIKNRLDKLTKVPIYNQIYGFTSNSSNTYSSESSLDM